MIEITHKQAQHLIRQGIDRRLPDEQWSALQAHLERCPECSAYRARLAGSERRLNHALHLRWGSARGPVRPIAEELIKRRRRMAKLRRFTGRAVWGVLAVLLLFGYITYRRLTAPEPPRPVAVPKAGPTVTPRPQETDQPLITFRGLAAFESRKDGNAEIYLLNASGGHADLTNLTQNPANDTAPAWSPDGEWIAFLSDRSGKSELYVLTVAGSRLTQLTSAPEIEWQGPLEWSSDGSRIALTGRRGLNGPGFLYLVPLNGTAPGSIANTRGALPWARFSSSMPMLAYIPDAIHGGLEVVNVETGSTVFVTTEDTNTYGFRTARSGAFDWSLGGRGLVYAADGEGGGEKGSMLRLSPELGVTGTNEFSGAGTDTIDRLPGTGMFRAVSWVPNSLQVAALQDADADGCWTLRIDHAYNRQVAPRDIPGLCIIGGLEHSNWTADGNWLVLVARKPDESEPGIYAVRMQADDESAAKPLFERMANIDVQPAPADEPAGPALRVRPSARSLGISPRAAASLAAAATPQPTAQPTRFPPAGAGGLPQWVYFTVRREAGQQIFRSRPDGTQPEPLTPDGVDAWCPRVGPTGKVAYLVMGHNSPLSEIYRMDADGKNVLQLTGQGFPEPDDQRETESVVPGDHCPVWSPDGTRLAVYAWYQTGTYLSIIPVDGKTAPTYVRIEDTGRSAPVWMPARGGAAISGEPDYHILFIYPQDRQPARLMELNLNLLPKDQPVVADPGAALSTALVLTGWHDAFALSLAPDGKHLAALLVYYNSTATRETGLTFGQLRVYDAGNLVTIGAAPLNNFDPNTAGQGALGWLDNGTAGLVRTTSLVGSQKTTFERFDWRTNDIDTLTYVEDLVYSTAWNAGWVMYAAESGLWAMDFTRENPLPAQLNGELISEVEWK